MKTKLILLLLLSFYFSLLSSQIPQGFNYQAIARDASTGNVLANTSIQVDLSILSDTLTPVVVWEELFNSVRTNAYGLFAVVIGTGLRQSGVATFPEINWATSPLYLKTQVYYSGSWKYMGTSKLWSVPYSMMAADLGSTIDKLRVKGQETSPDSVLFEVKNRNGQTVFAVYSEGVRIYVDDGIAKSAKGGFAIGGFGTDKGVSQKYLIVKPDSIRMYVDDRPGKTAKGGFAIGGFGTGKYPAKHLLIVNPDSIRAYIDTTSVGKSAKGGFAIGGFGTGKGSTSKYLSVDANRTNISVNDSTKGFSITSVQGGTNTEFMNINKINYAIGHESGLKTVPNFSSALGRYNVFFGYRAGYKNETGYGNIFEGHESGFGNVDGSYNVYMGYHSGNTNASGLCNVFMGYLSGEKSSGSYDTYLGQGAGSQNTDGIRNTYVGGQSGIDDGKYNTNPLYPSGNDNVFLGYRAGAKHWTGNQNVYIGSYAGENKYGDSRIFIGYMAGRNETKDSLLYIAVSSTTSPLIWGNFDKNIVRINGDLEYTGNLTHTSDVRLKENLQPFTNTLDNLIQLNTYRFTWKQGIIPDLKLPASHQIGLIAQEVEKYFPEAVTLSTNGYKTVNYTMLGALVIPAIKELNNKIEDKTREIENLTGEIEQLKSKLISIEEKINSNSK